MFFLFFAVRYFLNPLSKRYHFGHVDGSDSNIIFSLRKIMPAFTGRNQERQAHLTKGVATLKELLSDGRFESDDWRLFRKPDFFFGDSIEENEENLYGKNYKWLRQIENQCFSFPI